MNPDMKSHIQTPAAPAGRGPFPQALAAGPFVFVSGQGPLLPQSNQPARGEFALQVRQTLGNVEAILAAANLGLEHIVKVTVYLTDLANVPAFNEIYERLIPEPRPARTLVQAGLRGIDVEVDVIAMDPKRVPAQAV
jgi:2-iminobutanoate/2-iminopropanoate deaminase